MTYRTANQPSRASNSLTLSFGGLINIPLSVYGGTEETKVARKEFVRDTEVSVGRANIRKDNGDVIEDPSNNVVRKAQATNGTWVEFNDDEVAAATSPKGLADIVTFVPNANVAHYLPQGQVQLRPKSTKGKVDAAASKAYGLFLAVLRETKSSALIKVALRGPARYGLLTAEGDLVFIHTSDAVRQPRALDDHTYSDKELALAVSLAESIGFDAPVLTDDTAEAVQAAVDAKAGGAPTPTPAPETPSPADLEALLAASIKARKGGEAA